MKTNLNLPNGATGFTDDSGRWTCTGSQMGRSNVLPADAKTLPVKLRLIHIRFVDGCYDQWGAYWGAPANVWCATATVPMVECGCCGCYHRENYGGDCRNDAARFSDWEGNELFQVFTRANSRAEAKQAVRKSIPNARFYR